MKCHNEILNHNWDKSQSWDTKTIMRQSYDKVEMSHNYVIMFDFWSHIYGLVSHNFNLLNFISYMSEMGFYTGPPFFFFLRNQ